MLIHSKYYSPFLISLVAAFFIFTSVPAFGASEDKEKPTTGLANPASTYCIEKGGQLVIQKMQGGGEYGVCVFADNRQCEEWALFRGECPVGGIAVMGCVSPAALFCAITGGQYSEAGSGSGNTAAGVCLFKNGRSCDAGDYYNGKCSKNN